MNKLIIVSGGSASGKTTVSIKLQKMLKEKSVIITLDDFYKDISAFKGIEKEDINFDHPSSFEWDLLYTKLQDILNNKVIDVPIYDFVTCERSKETRKIEPKPVIIFEGILSSHDQKINELASMIIFVSTAADIRLARRIKRDVNERGRDINGVLKQWESTVRPMHSQFISPTKKYAHIIIPEGGSNEVGMQALYAGIEKLIK